MFLETPAQSFPRCLAVIDKDSEEMQTSFCTRLLSKITKASWKVWIGLDCHWTKKKKMRTRFRRLWKERNTTSSSKRPQSARAQIIYPLSVNANVCTVMKRIRIGLYPTLYLSDLHSLSVNLAWGSLANGNTQECDVGAELPLCWGTMLTMN